MTRPVPTMEQTVYDLIGDAGFERLVSAFYRRVPVDPVLGPMYHPHDLPGAEERLRGFLVYRFGGPPRYVQERGHPALRMRHAPFVIGGPARDHWLALMAAALQEAELPAPAAQALWQFFTHTATFLMNAPE